jgi:hypothetical protein
MELLTFVTAGSVDDGKSTSIGRLANLALLLDARFPVQYVITPALRRIPRLPMALWCCPG